MKLYYHKTDGGAEYLFDKYVVCPNGHKEGVVEGANYMVRLDGQPELTIRDPVAYVAPDLLAACEHFREWFADHFENFDHEINQQLLCLDNEADAALAKATGKTA